jgi:hypothetical protein
MTFSEVLSDVKELVGVKLRSIKSGADIELLSICPEDDRLELIDAGGNRRSRSVNELRRIWEALCASGIVHVDSVLAGSGSSRNQPETILANLPYVEWLTVDRKKHLALVKAATHDAGSLKQMDSVDARVLIEKMQQAKVSPPAAVVVTENSRQITKTLESLTGLPPSALAEGLYRQPIAGHDLLVISKSSLPIELPCGCYPVLPKTAAPEKAVPVTLGGTLYKLVRTADLSFFIVCD